MNRPLRVAVTGQNQFSILYFLEHETMLDRMENVVIILDVVALELNEQIGIARRSSYQLTLQTILFISSE
jgi:hypothetical protein